jgi:hypothetical protein
VYYENINGVNKNSRNEWNTAATAIKEYQVDIFGCAETNIAWTEPSRKFAQHQMKQQLKHANLTVTSSNEVGSTNYQPGGVASCVTGNWTGCIVKSITDSSELGRWAGHRILGKNNRNIPILTAYRSVKANGLHTSYQ